MTCAQIDTMFRMSEQQISDKIVEKKFKLGQNAYWGRVPDEGMFPEKSGLNIKKIRLSRPGFGQGNVGWEKMVDEGCNTNICSRPQAETVTHGSTDYTFGLERFRVATEKICLSLIPFRQMGARELLQLQNSLQIVSQWHWNEYLRTRYIALCENKYVAQLTDDAFDGDLGTCDILESGCAPFIEATNGFVFWFRGLNGPTLDSQYSLDERYVSVNIPPSKIRNISELSADLLEQAAINLQYEDDNRQFISQGIDSYDVILPDIKMGRRLRQLERMQEAGCVPQVMYDGKDLSRQLGIKSVLRENLGLRYDDHGMKFYPDEAFNAGQTDAAYDSNNPTTWPRFVRVYAYTMERNPNGSINFKGNRWYTNAPFGISVIFTPTVMGMVHPPEAKSVGSATVGDMARHYGGQAKWVNKYDKDCNPDEEIGHWELHFGAGIEPNRPENGHAFFHRIDNRIALAGSPCPVPLKGNTVDNLTLDCYPTALQTGESTFVAAGSRGRNNIDVHVNGYQWLI